MKRLLFCCIASLLVSPTARSQYVNSTREQVPINDFGYKFRANPGDNTFPVFDFTEIDADGFLDLATAQNMPTSYPPQPGWYYFGDWRSNTQATPSFQTLNNFYTQVNDPSFPYARDVAFGQLRVGQKKDFAIARDNATEIYLNQGNTIQPGPYQSLTGGTVSVAWGAVDQYDALQDLAVTGGNQVRVYQNLNGTLGTSPLVSISLSTNKIILAQMNRDIYKSYTQPDKQDLICASGNTIYLYINSNNDRFDTLQTVPVPDFADHGIKDFAIGDLNNDGYNDIVVTHNENPYGSPLLEVFLNNGSGRLNSTPAFTLQFICCYTSPLVTIADLGSPNGNGSRNDGWNDIVLVGDNTVGGILINTGTSTLFNQAFDQQLPYAGSGGYESAKQVRAADVQNLGGQSVIIATKGGGSFSSEWSVGAISLFKHTGNPAPAPPKNVSVTATPPDPYGYRHPKVTWAANTERDLNGYDVWRRITGQCGNGTPYYLGSTSGTEYTDVSIGTAGMGSECRAWYKVQAKDNGVPIHFSDFSAEMWIDYANFMFKRNGNDGGTLSAPTTYALHAAFPNPFNPSTQIKFDLPEDGLRLVECV